MRFKDLDEGEAFRTTAGRLLRKYSRTSAYNLGDGGPETIPQALSVDRIESRTYRILDMPHGQWFAHNNWAYVKESQETIHRFGTPGGMTYDSHALGQVSHEGDVRHAYYAHWSDTKIGDVVEYSTGLFIRDGSRAAPIRADLRGRDHTRMIAVPMGGEIVAISPYLTSRFERNQQPGPWQEQTRANAQRITFEARVAQLNENWLGQQNSIAAWAAEYTHPDDIGPAPTIHKRVCDCQRGEIFEHNGAIYESYGLSAASGASAARRVGSTETITLAPMRLVAINPGDGERTRLGRVPAGVSFEDQTSAPELLIHLGGGNAYKHGQTVLMARRLDEHTPVRVYPSIGRANVNDAREYFKKQAPTKGAQPESKKQSEAPTAPPKRRIRID